MHANRGSTMDSITNSLILQIASYYEYCRWCLKSKRSAQCRPVERVGSAVSLAEESSERTVAPQSLHRLWPHFALLSLGLKVGFEFEQLFAFWLFLAFSAPARGLVFCFARFSKSAAWIALALDRSDRTRAPQVWQRFLTLPSYLDLKAPKFEQLVPVFRK